jgi:hypothetical protein
VRDDVVHQVRRGLRHAPRTARRAEAAALAAEGKERVVAAFAAAGLGRLHRALWENQRYWFTTWRWGKVLGAMLLIGAVLKLSMPA